MKTVKYRQNIHRNSGKRNFRKKTDLGTDGSKFVPSSVWKRRRKRNRNRKRTIDAEVKDGPGSSSIPSEEKYLESRTETEIAGPNGKKVRIEFESGKTSNLEACRTIRKGPPDYSTVKMKVSGKFYICPSNSTPNSTLLFKWHRVPTYDSEDDDISSYLDFTELGEEELHDGPNELSRMSFNNCRRWCDFSDFNELGEV